MSTITEEEAKKKWCPFAGDITSGCVCIGSRCMAWRKDVRTCELPLNERPAGSGWEVYEVKAPITIWIRRAGYCGLAGKP